VPTLHLTGGKPATTRKPAAKATPKRKPAAKAPATRTRKPAAKAAPASTNGAATRGPKLPEGWTKADFNQVVKDMQKARKARESAEVALKEAQREANVLALDMISQGIQMSVVSTELVLSRQWLYKIMEDAEEYGFDGPVVTERQATPARKPAAKKRPAAGRTSKPAAKKRPAAKAKPAPAAKRSPARKPPASKRAPAGRGRVRIAR